MTAHERWTAVMERKLADRVPMDYWATPEATDRLLSYLFAISTKCAPACTLTG